MSFKCVICDHSLSHSFPDEEFPHIVAVNCGHVFHSVCINKWIQTKKSQRTSATVTNASTNVNQSMSEKELKRLYLEEDCPSDSKKPDVIIGMKSRADLDSENQHLSEELARLSVEHEEVLNNWQAMYQSSVNEIEILKTERAARERGTSSDPEPASRATTPVVGVSLSV